MGLIPKSDFLDYNLTSNDPVLKDIARKLFEELKIQNYKKQQKLEFIVMLLANLKLRYPLSQHSIIPRKKEFYTKAVKRYKKSIRSARNTIEILDALENAGYINKHDSIKQELSTEYIPTKKLITLLLPVSPAMLTVDRPESFIILRQGTGDNKTEIDFIDTTYTEKIQEEISLYSRLREQSRLGFNDVPRNLVSKHSDILHQTSTDVISKLNYSNNKTEIRLRNSYLVRIFNNDFNHGGRFYRGSESIMPKDLRELITINGNKTVELDYSAMHMRMLYHKKKINYYDDPYMVSPKLNKDMRNIYKLVGLVSINAGDLNKAIDSLQQEIQSANLLVHLPDNTDVTRSKLCKDFINHNKRIQDKLFTGAGLELQKIDSDIAHEILVSMAQEGILTLCVHDSFIVEEKHKKTLKKKMREKYYEILHFYPKIK